MIDPHFIAHHSRAEPRRLRAARCLLGILVCTCGLAAGCRSAHDQTQQPEDEVIGRPPSAESDPFAGSALPPEAVPAEASGTVGDEDDVVNSVNEGSDDEVNGVHNASGPSPEPSEESAEVAARDATAEEATPDAEQAQQAPPAADGAHRCFSCVRVCPVSDTSSDCSASPEDLICGWGTSQVEADAQTLAQKECDAALDMVRQMPRFSRIRGACPAASCR